MSLFDGTQNVIEPYEIVESFRNILAADLTLVNGTTFLVAAADVHLNEADEPHAERYVSVREAEIAGSTLQAISGRELVPIHVAAFCHRDHGMPHKWLSAVHRVIFQAVVNQKPSLTRQALELPFFRQTTPTAPSYDDETKEWVSSALYYAVAKPI